MKPTPEEIAEFDALNERDIADWEKGDAGKNPAFNGPVAAEVAVAFKNAKKAMLPPTSIRLPEELRGALRRLAEDQGLSYQAYVRMVLTLHVKEKDKQAS
jgi:predicted DNA binding CopG/RHH family protein